MSTTPMTRPEAPAGPVAPSMGIGVAISAAGRVLLVRDRGSACWTLPAAPVSAELTVEHMVHRLAREHVGGEVRAVDFVALLECGDADGRGGVGNHGLIVVFEVAVSTGTATSVPGRETRWVRWADLAAVGLTPTELNRLSAGFPDDPWHPLRRDRDPLSGHPEAMP